MSSGKPPRLKEYLLLPRWMILLLGGILLLGLTASSIALVRTTQQQGDLERAQTALDREVMERISAGQRVLVQLRTVERRARRTTCSYLNRFARGEAARLRLQGFTVRLAPIACGRFEVSGQIAPRAGAPPSAPAPGVPQIVTVDVPVPGPAVTTTVAVPVPSPPETIEVPVPSPPETTTVPGPTMTAPPRTVTTPGPERTVPGPTVTQTVEIPPPPPPTTAPEMTAPVEPPPPPPVCEPGDLLCEVVDILTP